MIVHGEVDSELANAWGLSIGSFVTSSPAVASYTITSPGHLLTGTRHLQTSLSMLIILFSPLKKAISKNFMSFSPVVASPLSSKAESGIIILLFCAKHLRLDGSVKLHKGNRQVRNLLIHPDETSHIFLWWFWSLNHKG